MGRVHTSTMTVAVLPQPQEVGMLLDPHIVGRGHLVLVSSGRKLLPHLTPYTLTPFTPHTTPYTPYTHHTSHPTHTTHHTPHTTPHTPHPTTHTQHPHPTPHTPSGTTWVLCTVIREFLSAVNRTYQQSDPPFEWTCSGILWEMYCYFASTSF